MTWGDMGSLKVLDGKRDELVAILIRQKPEPAQGGCLDYEVGTSSTTPDRMHVLDIRDSAESHRASLRPGSVREALPLLDGDMVSMKLDIAGSPLSP